MRIPRSQYNVRCTAVYVLSHSAMLLTYQLESGNLLQSVEFYIDAYLKSLLNQQKHSKCVQQVRHYTETVSLRIVEVVGVYPHGKPHWVLWIIVY